MSTLLTIGCVAVVLVGGILIGAAFMVYAINRSIGQWLGW